MALREILGLSHVYIAALIGWNDQTTRELVVLSGFGWHLTKPANVNTALQLVAHER